MNLSEKIHLIQATSSSLLKRTTVQAPLIHSYEILKDLDALEKEVHFILKNKKSLRLIVSQLLLRRWTTASFWMALRKVNEARKHSSRDDERFVKQAQFAALWAYQACGVIHTATFVKKIVNNLDHFTLHSTPLEKGDVVLSYKSSTYLNHNPLSRLIAISTGSHITHSLMVFDNKAPQHLVSSSASSSGLALKKVLPERGEMFIVMRYVSSINGVPKENIIESMDSLYKMEVLEDSFAELKSWIALWIGLIYGITSLLFERPLCLSNPVRGNFTIFCSEFVDDVFRRAGVYISPRSEYPAVVGPVDLFYSPLLEFKGVIFHPEDKVSFTQELSKTFALPL